MVAKVFCEPENQRAFLFLSSKNLLKPWVKWISTLNSEAANAIKDLHKAVVAAGGTETDVLVLSVPPRSLRSSAVVPLDKYDS